MKPIAELAADLAAGRSTARALAEQALARDFRTLVGPHAVYPKLFACPNAAGRASRGGKAVGAAFLMSPWSGAAAA